MKNFQKDMNDVAAMAKALVLKVEKLQKQYAEMMEKHPKMPAKKATPKRTAAKKTTTPKRTVARKTVAKKTAPKQLQTTAGDTVLAIVKRSKKGVDTASVMKKTGFDRKKVANIFARMKKQGKIKNAGKGIYIKG